MKERYLYLDARIKKSNKIGMICCREESRKELMDFLIKFSNIYPEKYSLLINIRDKKIDEEFFEFRLNERCDFHEYVFDDTYQGNRNQEAWIGNSEKWRWVLSHYELPNKHEPIIKMRKKGKKVIIYGAGFLCKKAIEYLSELDIMIDGIAVTKEEDNPTEVMGVEVKRYTDYKMRDCIFIIAVNGCRAR